MMVNKLSLVHPDAKLGQGVEVGAFAKIDGNVEIGEGTWIGSHAIIMDNVKIGKNCKIFPGAVVGAIPQDLKYAGESSMVEIGDNVVIREYATINRGTADNYSTIVKKNTLLMAYVHVAHDCIIEENCIVSNSVNLAGHIHVGPHVIIGGMVAVHQFVHIGEHAFIGGGTLVRKDVPPYIKAAREPISYAGVNSIGLKRRGFTTEQVHHIQDIYRYLFVKGYNTKKAIKLIQKEVEDSPQKQRILEFVLQSNRGIIKGFNSLNGRN